MDADIKGFFDHMKHEWIIKFLNLYIKDPNIIGLVKKYLKVGVLDGGELMMNEEGAAQGGLCRARHNEIGYCSDWPIWWWKDYSIASCFTLLGCGPGNDYSWQYGYFKNRPGNTHVTVLDCISGCYPV